MPESSTCQSQQEVIVLGGLNSSFNGGTTVNRNGRINLPRWAISFGEADMSERIFATAILAIALIVGANIWLGTAATPYG
jgi:hypothetical protein